MRMPGTFQCTRQAATTFHARPPYRLTQVTGTFYKLSINLRKRDLGFVSNFKNRQPSVLNEEDQIEFLDGFGINSNTSFISQY